MSAFDNDIMNNERRETNCIVATVDQADNVFSSTPEIKPIQTCLFSAIFNYAISVQNTVCALKNISRGTEFHVHMKAVNTKAWERDTAQLPYNLICNAKAVFCHVVRTFPRGFNYVSKITTL